MTEVPPHDEAAEAAENAVLSAIFIAPETLVNVRRVLEPQHFHFSRNQYIYRAILDVDDDGKPVDIVAVGNVLRARNQLQEFGQRYLAEVVDATPAVANVQNHAILVRDAAIKRQLISFGRRVAAEFANGVVNVPEAIGALQAELERIRKPVAPELEPVTPSQIVQRWHRAGPLVRIPTGIAALDNACRGGLPVPWRVFIVGAPSAGKTFQATVIANHLARGDVCVGILAVDEDPEDIVVRLAQIAGFRVLEAEERDPHVLDAVSSALDGLQVRLYGHGQSIESSAADLAKWAGPRDAALFIDSIQAARSEAAGAAQSPREIVEANAAAVREVSTSYRMLVVATSEANRGSYRSEATQADTNDLAAGAESRAIEYGAQTLLVLRTPKDHPDVVHVRIAKNRRAHVGEFWLRLDREHHTLAECADPAGDPKVAEEKANKKRQRVIASLDKDCRILAELVRRNPGIGERKLRDLLRADGHSWGIDRLGAVKERLTVGTAGVQLFNRGEHARDVRYFIEANGGSDA